MDGLSPTNLLEEFSIDFAAFSLRHRVWVDREQLWRKWIRSI